MQCPSSRRIRSPVPMEGSARPTHLSPPLEDLVLHSFITNCKHIYALCILPDCDGALVDIYSTCCPTSAIDCEADNANAHCRSCSTEGMSIATNFLSESDMFLFSGVLCPSTHPFAFKSGEMCCSDPYKAYDTASSACNGGLLNFDDDCCEANKAVVCSNNPAKRCKNNPHFGWCKKCYSNYDPKEFCYKGHICPSSHRYACAAGTKCALSPWKPASGGGGEN